MHTPALLWVDLPLAHLCVSSIHDAGALMYGLDRHLCPCAPGWRGAGQRGARTGTWIATLH